jgi:hypothetical protein
MRAGLKLHQGSPAGRDPREMTQDELREAGHEPMSPLQALRARCTGLRLSTPAFRGLRAPAPAGKRRDGPAPTVDTQAEPAEEALVLV